MVGCGFLQHRGPPQPLPVTERLRTLAAPAEYITASDEKPPAPLSCRHAPMCLLLASRSSSTNLSI